MGLCPNSLYMEGTKINIHGKDYWRIVDKTKVEARRLDIIANSKALFEDQKRQFKKIEIL
jgi:hypothetical protein